MRGAESERAVERNAENGKGGIVRFVGKGIQGVNASGQSKGEIRVGRRDDHYVQGEEVGCVRWKEP